MGLAASQARFLQLTARRSNIEYMGQQINQQRLALANQSAGLFQRQLTLVAPTPPSSLDSKYMTPAYDFVDPTDGIKKNIRVTGYNSTTHTITSFTITNQKYNVDGTMTTVTVNSGSAGAPVLSNLVTITTATVGAGGGVGGILVGAASTLYISSGRGNGTYGTTEVGSNYGGYGFDENTGRLTSLLFIRTSSNGVAQPSMSQQVSLTYAPIFDKAAYGDDMNKYEYQKSTYDYEIERINTQTAEIQQKDKSLELKMKQLDTEHNAVQTEMEAVQKVIQTGVEGSFKTFS